MWEIAVQIIGCLIIAAILGFILGYLLSKIRCNAKSKMDSDQKNQEFDQLSSGKGYDVDARPNLLPFPDGEKDDLKMISGIGPKIEKALNDLGVFHFSQIANFSDENLSWVDNYLAFSGRAIRDNWIGQSRELASGEDTAFSKRYKKT